MTSCPKCGISQTISGQYCSTCGTIIVQKSTGSDMNFHKWENRTGSLFGSFFSLIGTLLSSPAKVFSRITMRSRMGTAILFYVLLVLITAPSILVSQIGDFSEAASSEYGSFVIPMMLMQPVITLILGTAGLFISAGLLQLLFMITGVKKASYKETFVAYCYSSAPLIILLFPIPILPAIVVNIWGFVLQVIGMAELHKVGRGKMFLIQIIPLVIMWILLIIFIVLMVAMITAVGISMSDTLPIQELLDSIR